MPGNFHQGQHGYYGGGAQGAVNDITDPIPSPYNFVPLSKHVFSPDGDWASKVSMDVPFSDGICGTLQVKVTARTPIYIRNGGAHPEGLDRLSDPHYLDFFQVFPGGPYAIPGSSFKGMLRSVIEIATFGKIAGTAGRQRRVDNHRYALRDLSNKYYKKCFTEETITGFRPRVLAGWLNEGENEEWSVELCDFARVEQKLLEDELAPGNFLGVGSATNKYCIIKPLSEVVFTCGPESPHEHSLDQNGHRKILVYRKVESISFKNRCECLVNGEQDGVLVMTGQPSKRDGRPGKKHMEFVFFGTKGERGVEEQVKHDFEFAHSAELGENRKPNEDWGFWKEELKKGRKIPVFVLCDAKGDIKSMGLAMMFRLPYENDIHQTIAHTSAKHLDGTTLDFCETLFGRVEDKEGLRGRVCVEALTAETVPAIERQTVLTVLNGPKPTYYPNYVKQDMDRDGRVRGEHRTYMDEKSEIRGWKRYITREEGFQPAPPPPPADPNTHGLPKAATSFCPLPATSVFIGTIHVHNLRPEELGALVWALTWGGKTELRHSLGMGKPLGFGSVTSEIVGQDLAWCDPYKTDTVDLDVCKNMFVRMMQKGVEGWSDSEQIRSLFAMADPRMEWPQDLEYPELGAPNKFVEHKDKHNPHALVSPLAATPREKQHYYPTKKAVELSPVDRFLSEFDRMSVKDVSKRLKSYKLDPLKVTTEDRLRIFQKMKKKPGTDAPNFKSVLDQWKP